MSKDQKKEQPVELFITNRTLKVITDPDRRSVSRTGQSLTYQIKNLTFVKTDRLDIKYSVHGAVLCLVLVLSLAAVYANDKHREEILEYFAAQDITITPGDWEEAYPWAMTILAGIFVVGVLERLFRRHDYELILETSSGSTSLLMSKDKRFIEEVVEIITDVMDDDGVPVNYTVNVQKRKVINNIKEKRVTKYKSEKVMGDVFRDIQNATIINRSAVQDAIKSVQASSGQDASNAIAEVASAVEQSKNPAAAALMNSFSEELNKPTPDKSALRSFWESLTQTLPSITKLTEACKKIVTLFS